MRSFIDIFVLNTKFGVVRATIFGAHENNKRESSIHISAFLLIVFVCASEFGKHQLRPLREQPSVVVFFFLSSSHATVWSLLVVRAYIFR